MSTKINRNPSTLAHTYDCAFITPSILESTTFLRHPNVGSHKCSGFRFQVNEEIICLLPSYITRPQTNIHTFRLFLYGMRAWVRKATWKILKFYDNFIGIPWKSVVKGINQFTNETTLRSICPQIVAIVKKATEPIF